MLKYLIILLNDQSASICHYNVSDRGNGLIPIEKLQKAITFGLKQNLYFQFIMPFDPLPIEYTQLIKDVDGVCYTPLTNSEIDIKGCVKIEATNDHSSKDILLVPISLKSPFHNIERSLIKLINNEFRISIILRNIEDANAQDLERYSDFLKNMVEFLTNIYFPQKESPLNIITDRLYLSKMNNCNAGLSSITFAPDGNFYLCPAFYYERSTPLNVNKDGIIIPNKYLLKLENAPICSNCDAFHCHRCIYLNQKGTREVNTPTRNQCIVSHIERSASRLLASKLNWIKEDECIPSVDYLDPFEITQRK